MLVLAGAFLNIVVDDLLGAYLGGPDVPGPQELDPGALGGAFWWVLAGLVALLLGVFAAVVLVAWWFTRYQVTPEHVRVRSGVLFRQERQARLDRVQAIDIHRPFLPRLLGLAELKFEVADAGQSAVSLAYLTHPQARLLRSELLGRIGLAGPATAGPPTGAPGAAGGAGGPGAGPPLRRPPWAPHGEEELPVLRVPPARLIGSVSASGSAVVLAVLLAAAPAALLLDPVGGPGVLVAWLPGLISFGAVLYRRLEQGYDFRLLRIPEGLRVRYGLFNVRSQTVPTGRIQAVGVDQPVLWRPFGWYRVRVNVAGYGASAGEEDALRSTLLPVGTLPEVRAVLALALPRVHDGELTALLGEGLHGLGAQGRYTTSPRRARWVDPLVHRRTGFAATDEVLAVRSGRLGRRTAVLPHEKTQSVAVSQGPLERALGLADVHLHSTPGPVTVLVPHLDTADARALAAAQAEHAAGARRLADGPHRPRDPQQERA
jgi:putative membrane protein